MREENQRLLENFILNLKASQKSENTIKSYRFAIQMFFDSIGDKLFTDIDYADAEDFQNWLFSTCKSSSTINLRKAALSTFSKWVKKRERKNHPEFDNVFEMLDAIPKKEKRHKAIWNKEQVFSLIAEVEQTGDIELTTLLALAVYSGRRRAELLRFKVSDFAEERLCCNNQFYLSSEIQTKGRCGKPLECYIFKDFKPYLDNWLRVRQYDSEYVFENINDGKMGTFARAIKRKHPDFHWHLIRHTYVTLLMDSGIDKEIITKIIGWESSDMVNTYYDKTRNQQIESYFEKEIFIPF